MFTGGSFGDTTVQNNGLLSNILFPGQKERYQFKKQAAFNKDIQQQGMNNASNALAVMMQQGAGGYKNGGMTTEHTVAGALGYENGTNRIDLKDGLMTGAVTKKGVDTPIAAQSVNGPVTVHGGSKDKPSGELVMDAKRTKMLEDMAKDGDATSVGKFVIDTMNYYKSRDGVSSAKDGAYPLAKRPMGVNYDTSLEEENYANSLNLAQVKSISTPKSDSYTSNLLTTDDRIDGGVRPNAGIKLGNNPMGVNDELPNISDRFKNPAMQKIKPIGSSNTESVYDMINRSYDSGRKGDMAKQGVNLAQGLINMGKKFDPNAVPKLGSSTFVPNTTDFESVKQVGKDSINKSYAQAKRALEENNRPDLIVGVNANKLSAEKELNSNVAQQRIGVNQSNAQGLAANANENTNRNFQNDSNLYNAANQFNQGKNKAISDAVSNALNLGDASKESRRLKDQEILKNHATEQMTDFQKDLAAYEKGEKSFADLKNWQSKGIKKGLFDEKTLRELFNFKKTK